MRKRSLKRQREINEFKPLAEAFLEANPWCTYPGCTSRSVIVHHSRGRQGRRLLDQAWWRAACHHHNQAAEDDTGTALAVGWLVRIEGV